MRRTLFASSGTIRGSLVALIAMALTPLVIFGVFEVVRSYQAQRDAEVRASAEVANVVAAAFESFVQALVRTEHAVGVSLARSEHTAPEIEAELAAVQSEFPPVRDMSWIDARGTVVVSTEPQLDGKSFFAREYFQEIVAGAEWRVSPLMRSVIDSRPVFIVARGFRGPSGALVGIVVAAVDAERLGKVVAHRSGRGFTAIVDSAGTLVALQAHDGPPLDWQTRRRAAEHPWVQQALSGTPAFGIFRSSITGGTRIGATVPIPSIGWAAHASRPLGEAIAPVRSGAIAHAAVLLAVVLGALGAALVLARNIAEPLRALEQHAARLAANAPHAVPVRGPAEVRRVAHALESMAASLAARRAELEEVNRALERASRAAEQAAAAAAAHGAELEAVIAALPVALVMVSPAREVVRANQTACAILGFPEGDLPRCTEALVGVRLLDPAGRALAQEERPFARALRGEVVRGEILRIVREGGSAAWIAASASPVRDRGGAVRGAVATFVDITTLRELQEERETIVQAVSHDLRTPLHVIVSHAEILRRRSDEEARARGEAILASAARMTRLIGDLVDAARIEAGHLSLVLEPVDLGAFLARWKDRMAGALETDRIRVEAAGPVPAVLADPARLDQILGNLVSNALKYSLADSEVRVRLATAGAALRLSVSDRGPGIPPDELPRVFERYYRAPSAARAEGLGLGLFITRKLVEAHGWRIEVASEPGEGSVFTVVIPATGGRAGRASPAAA